MDAGLANADGPLARGGVQHALLHSYPTALLKADALIPSVQASHSLQLIRIECEHQLAKCKELGIKLP